jgi:hypothetical protein
MESKMSDFRIINKRDEEPDCCASGGCSGCDCSEPQDTSGLWTPGTLLKSKLSGDQVMVLKAQPARGGEPASYVVRTKTYEAVMLLEFELELPTPNPIR